MVLYLLFPLVLLGAALYVSYRRLYLSPISHIPGPKLAAVTRLYEAYYDLWLGGQYTFKIIALHKKYGPIIRISPWEIHVADPDFYEVVYASSASGHRRDKYDWFTKSFGLDNAVFATPGHDLHRLRRSALAPYFSMASARRLQPLLQERVDKLLERFEGFRDTGEVLNTSLAYAAFTNDVVMTYCFARHDNRLEAPDFDPSYRDASYFGSTAGNYLKHAPWVNNFMQSLPNSIAELLHPAMASFVAQKRDVLAHIQSITSGHNASHQDLSHPTIFHTILDCKLPDHEKRDDRLSDDAQVLTMAGTLTTAWVLEVTTFHLLSNPSILRALKAELSTAIPSRNDIGAVPLPTLESLPYLNAVIKEGLRLTYGVSCRLARRDPDNAIPFTDKATGKTYTIPPGTPIGMTSVQIHHDESLFPDSWTFRPDRWLAPGSKALEKYMVSFTAGSRQCLGMNLAYCELYLAMSAVWRVWGSREVRGVDDVGFFGLWETDKTDVEIQSDAFLPIVRKGSQGIRVKAFGVGE
ncbi:Cyrochrome P450 monooxygenase [Lachnellula willkommii]|uniref:Cyrochrome P450 monooxygenase n=1 Tax=Lachnellula willkommii TaxID=215461 RepID=A0A559MJS3_9HELO|nr:Cyrochrome P450 monooxygenase [Lachnellula willkommii]